MTDVQNLPPTEQRNPRTMELDMMSTEQIVRVMNEEDAGVAAAVAHELPQVAAAAERIAQVLRQGGRLFYVGAGTSGRLALLDALECPPTFNTDPSQVVGLIAGGLPALTRAVEGAEDQPSLAIEDLRNALLTAADVVVGIATSGRTPYVMGAIEYARSVGAFCIGLSCNRDPELATRSDLSITPVVGPEVVSGSTRMKAGTATKMVLNTLSTGAMIQLGKTYGNLMVDLRASNLKLADRARRIVRAATNLSDRESEKLLRACGGEVKTAILSYHAGCTSDDARQRLATAHGVLAKALAAHRANNLAAK